MQDLENDMDNLFRKAANNYKPEAGDSYWGIIEPQLDRNTPVPTAIKASRKKSKMVLMLLLLPVITGVLNFYFINHAMKKKAAIFSFNSKAQGKSNAFVSNKKILQLNAGNATYKNQGGNTAYHKSISHQKFIAGSLDEHLLTQAILQSGLSNFNESPATIGNIANSSSTYSPAPLSRQDKIFLQDTNTNTYPSPATNKITTLARQNRFYLGIVLGGGFNQVKGQGFKKAGFNAGLLAGYKLNKNVSAETGLIYTRKNYFSDGKYFNMSKMPSNMKVFSLKGCIDAVEIPINIKYNAIHTNTSIAFMSAGISSYILTQENNNYLASVNGARQNLKGIYKKVSAGFASSINLSIGYEHAIGKQNAVRIQPYLQIPLKDMGIGNMKLTGTGINIALIKTFR